MRKRFRFSIMAMLLVTTVMALCLAVFLPYLDDTQFANSLQRFHDRPVSDLVEHANRHGRKIATQWSARRRLIGLTLRLRDGRQFEVGVDENGPVSDDFEVDLSTLSQCKVVESNPLVVGGFVDYD